MMSLLFWQRWLLTASVFLAVQGASWMVIGSFDPFGFYDQLAATTLAEHERIPEVAIPYYRFAIGLLGATDAAFFVLFWFVVRHPFAQRESWSHVALAASLLTWFTLDSLFSILLSAWFNVFIVNVPCLLLLGIPLIFTAKHFYGRPVY